jgi:hypothetical protein
VAQKRNENDAPAIIPLEKYPEKYKEKVLLPFFGVLHLWEDLEEEEKGLPPQKKKARSARHGDTPPSLSLSSPPSCVRTSVAVCDVLRQSGLPRRAVFAVPLAERIFLFSVRKRPGGLADVSRQPPVVRCRQEEEPSCLFLSFLPFSTFCGLSFSLQTWRDPGHKTTSPI